MRSNDAEKLIDFGIVSIFDQNGETGFHGFLAAAGLEKFQSFCCRTLSHFFSLLAVGCKFLSRETIAPKADCMKIHIICG
jgi:hypothetical protein